MLTLLISLFSPPFDKLRNQGFIRLAVGFNPALQPALRQAQEPGLHLAVGFNPVLSYNICTKINSQGGSASLAYTLLLEYNT